MNNNLTWGATTKTGSNSTTTKVIELVNGNFCSLIDTVKQFSATENLVVEQLFRIRDELINLETEIIKNSIRTDTAVK